MLKISEEEMRKLLLSVIEDLSNASRYLKIMRNLHADLLNEYKDVYDIAQTFWGNIFQSFFMAMQMCLMRSYEQTDGAIGLRLLLLRVTENINLFSNSSFEERMKDNQHLKSLLHSRESDQCFESEIKKYIDQVNNKKEVVKKLIIIRNNNGFHRSEEVLYGKKFNAQTIEVSLEDIEKLIDDGLRISNFCYYRFEATTHAPYMLNEEDYKIILTGVKKYLE